MNLKKTTKYFLYMILLALAVSGLNACSLFGLDVQEDYEYVHTPIQKPDMTAYQFIESRKSIDMSMLHEAINRIDYRGEFEKSFRTYIIFNDMCFNSFLTANKKMQAVSSMNDAQIKKTLDALILEGRYSSLELTTNPIDVPTLHTTARMTLYLNSSADNTNRYQVYVGLTGTTSFRDVKTSNIETLNGILHVIDYPLNIPW